MTCAMVEGVDLRSVSLTDAVEPAIGEPDSTPVNKRRMACEALEASSAKKTKRARVPSLEEPENPGSPMTIFIKDTLSKEKRLAEMKREVAWIELLKMWNELGPVEKMAYHIQFDKVKSEYEMQMSQYMWSLSLSKRKAFMEKRRQDVQRMGAPQPPSQNLEVRLFANEKRHTLPCDDKETAGQKIIDMWEALGTEDRAPYHALANKMKEEYDLNLSAYLRSQISSTEKELGQKKQNETLQQKMDEQEGRVTLKDVGGCSTDCLWIRSLRSRCNGLWILPPGNVYVSNITFNEFQSMFHSVLDKLSPSPCSANSAVIAGDLTGTEAGGIFGVTQIRGGGMRAKFIICSMTVTYRPKEQSLLLTTVQRKVTSS
eukprot:gnl/MRDRNA2_/MRDRNA2_118535_c0_seq1.p1 gnl/MRDRNA2_/MRDRNA2_118535_c0~~gnl/MRDRNA2_/MRDRNA2_118535_c0_seq1.p1  ORF type:complete len:388 (-),score=65.71 gnl/MRDRNA2_/MRDRNA2_118535_c0_seq1:566-1681(-)